MFRLRYEVWVVLFVTAMILNSLTSCVSEGLKEKTIINMSVETVQNFNLAEKINRSTKNNYKLKTDYNNRDNADVILRDSSNVEIEGYTKISDFYTSPVVLLAPRKAKNDNMGFVIANSSERYSPIYKDMEDILTGLRWGMDWEDVGISEEVAKGKINLIIPDRKSPDYIPVVKSFYLALNQGKTVTVDDIERLRPLVDEILLRCRKVENVGQEIYNFYKSEKIEHDALAVAPEYILNNNNAFRSNCDYGWVPVYSSFMTDVSLDLYVKEEIESVKEVLSTQSIGNKISMRQKYRDYTLNSTLEGFGYSPEKINIIKINDKAVNLIENDYKYDNSLFIGVTKKDIEAEDILEESKSEVTKIIDEAKEEQIENENNGLGFSAIFPLAIITLGFLFSLLCLAI